MALLKSTGHCYAYILEPPAFWYPRRMTMQGEKLRKLYCPFCSSRLELLSHSMPLYGEEKEIKIGCPSCRTEMDVPSGFKEFIRCIIEEG